MLDVTQRTVQHEWFSDNIDYLIPPCMFDPEHKSIDSFEKEDVLPLGIIRSGMKKEPKKTRPSELRISETVFVKKQPIQCNWM